MHRTCRTHHLRSYSDSRSLRYIDGSESKAQEEHRGISLNWIMLIKGNSSDQWARTENNYPWSSTSLFVVVVHLTSHRTRGEMMNLLFISCCLFSSLLQGIFSKSNPEGYLVNEYYRYASCEGMITAKIATALGICVNNGMMGAPWVNTYFIFTYDPNNGEILGDSYGNDPTCTSEPGDKAIFKMNSCSTAWNSYFSSFSSTPPIFTLDDPIVEQTLYNYTGDLDRPTCEEEDKVVTYYALFRDVCQFDCGAGDGSCLFTSCVNDVANITYSRSYSDDYDGDSCSMEITGTEILTDTCAQNITCYPGRNSKSGDDDNELSGGAIAGIVIAAVVVSGVMWSLVSYQFFRKPSWQGQGLSNELLWDRGQRIRSVLRYRCSRKNPWSS